MLDWATEMKDTFLPSGIAREYLKSQEWWKEIERFFNKMDTRMVGGSGIVRFQEVSSGDAYFTQLSHVLH